MPERTGRLHLGVAIDGTGAHPAAWRALAATTCDAAAGGGADAVVAALMTADTYVQRAKSAERGLLDFVVLDDALVPRTEPPVAQQGRLDALLTLARVAPHTSRVGLVATVNVTHTEPFNVAKNVATLDWVSLGRAGWRPVVLTDDAEWAHFGRRRPVSTSSLYAEAGHVIDVVAQLCDSWEDDAIIRDTASGRYLDRDKVHHVDFDGPFFAVRGPSITPRSPQAQPLVVFDGAAGSDAVTAESDATAARWADVIIVNASDIDAARQRRAALRRAVGEAGRDPAQVFVLVRLEVLLAASEADAMAELRALDGHQPWGQARSLRFVGTAEQLAAVLTGWARADAGDGFVVLPARLPVDLDRFVEGVVGPLGQAGVFRTAYQGTQLRQHFGLTRPPNRYAAGV